jgi:predicted O-methyltransferase YrrM
MFLETIARDLAGIPHMTLPQATAVTELILDNKFQSILELGFRHGVSTCYMAAALRELGEDGHITTIDLVGAQSAEPNIEQLLQRHGLSELVTVFYEPQSYVWRLMKLLEEDPTPRFDMCYIDGAHSWYVDGFAFFLVDKLLKPGGLIILDDLDWTFATYMYHTPLVAAMPEEEKWVPQVRKVYELLVKPHTSYGRFEQKDGWAYAWKISEEATSQSTVVRSEIVYEKVGLGQALLEISKKSIGLLRKLGSQSPN